jgi:hypothetical protein
MGILFMLCWLGSLICLILVVVKMFQTEGPLKAILGFICSLYGFIWGWMNKDKVGQNLMLIWTGLIILSIVLGIASGGFNYSYSYGTTP